MPVSELFDPEVWVASDVARDFTDITAHRSLDGTIVRIAFDRPEVRNAFRPKTVDELYRALEDARTDSKVGVVLLTGNGPSPKDGGWAFCSGGDQRIRGADGYRYEGDAGRGLRRAPAHPRGAAAHPVHAEGRHRPGARLGGRRRALPPHRLRPHDRVRRARPVQADGRGRRLVRRRVRQRLLRPPDRAEGGTRDLLPRPRVLGAARLRARRGERGRARTPSSSRRASSGRARSSASPRPRSGC